ncbi:hypothetical protein M3570_21760, partial [Bacillus subtilis]|nr:hypothetical protein [Bacillus subtilis]
DWVDAAALGTRHHVAFERKWLAEDDVGRRAGEYPATVPAQSHFSLNTRPAFAVASGRAAGREFLCALRSRPQGASRHGWRHAAYVPAVSNFVSK